MDIMNRNKSNRDRNENERIEEFSISNLVHAGMKDFTKNISEFINGESRLTAKKVLEGMYAGDEATLALIVLRTVITMIIGAENGKILLSSLSTVVAKSVLNSKTLSQLENEHKALSKFIDETYKRVSDSKKLKAKMRSALNLVGQVKEEEFLDTGSNSNSIGSMLISILAQSVDLVEIIKLSERCAYNGIHYNMFKPCSYLVQFTMDTKYSLLDLDEVARQFIKPTLRPLLIPPMPVTSWDMIDSDIINTGRPRNIIKMPKRKQNLKEFKMMMDKSSIKEYIKAHATIEKTEWTINEEVLDLMTSIFENNMPNFDLVKFKGEHFEFNPELLGGLPRRYSLMPDDILVKSHFGKTYVNTKGHIRFIQGEIKALNRYNKVANDLLAFNESNLNKALSLRSMLDIGTEYKGKSFWFTYQFDTRGRLYPVQGTLNPQTDKKGKSLLKFAGAGAKPLNEIGRYWAKVHGANCYGLDKENLEARVALIDTMVAEGTLQRIAEKPLLFTDLWSKADDPFGFFAFCVEYNKTLKDESYPYALACALDATCSGLQIYAGLLRDAEGAGAVNVTGKVRKDVYGLVAEVVNGYLASGDYPKVISYKTHDGIEETISTVATANSLKGKITRQITKKNTMTQPYSVTLKGMQDQLKAHFNEMEDHGDKFWVGENWLVARLLSELNQRAIDEVVKGAKKGKEFIKAVTSKCSERNRGLLWTSPMGFTVYQKNVKKQEFRVDSTIWTPLKGNQRVQFRIKKSVGLVNNFSQKNSSAPNVIHSLDGGLLQMTVNKCADKGVVSFALIHDSYGTHPNDIPILNVEVRESFIEIFSDDVLYNWAIEVLTNTGFTHEEMMMVFAGLDDPMLDTLDLNEVRKATFFFS